VTTDELRRKAQMNKALLVGLFLSFPALSQSDRIFFNGFESEEAGPPVCPSVPLGWSVGEKSWEVAFDYPNPSDIRPDPTYPNSVGSPSPVPGYRSYPYNWYTKGQIVAIPITPLPDKTVDMTWDTAQAQSGYGTPRPSAGMFINISTCKWNAHPTPDPRCSIFGGAGSMFYTTRDATNTPACPVDAGVQYYINVVMANPYDGLEPGEHSCQDNAQNTTTYNGCDVQMKHSGS
jgi:hypothetical protein